MNVADQAAARIEKLELNSAHNTKETRNAQCERTGAKQRAIESTHLEAGGAEQTSRERHEQLNSAPFRSSLAGCLGAHRSQLQALRRSLAPCRLCFRAMGRERRREGDDDEQTGHGRSIYKELAQEPRRHERRGGEPHLPVRRTWTCQNWAQGVSLPCKVGSGFVSPTSLCFVGA